ncbi:MAG TPA: HAD domain-containing protein [Rhodocyclaceae bacterium]|nr:HAD domain-containing protein [Rhodocyclaceae bacterium]
MILFLDFDGVLHPVGGKAEVFCCVPKLWQLLRACPEAQVVFSTSWRETYSMDLLVDFATSNGGEDLVHRFIGSTPVPEWSEDDPVNRLSECEAWLQENGHTASPWLAIDDNGEWFYGCPNLYLVDHATGLQESDVEAIARRIQHAQGT